MGLLRGAWGLIAGAGKWVFGASAAALGVEAATNPGDGSGGWTTRFFRGTVDAGITEASAAQARNAAWDAIGTARAGVTSFFAGTLSALFDALAELTKNEMFAGWADKLANVQIRNEQRINSMREVSRRNSATTLGETEPPNSTIEPDNYTGLSPEEAKRAIVGAGLAGGGTVAILGGARLSRVFAGTAAGRGLSAVFGSTAMGKALRIGAVAAVGYGAATTGGVEEGDVSLLENPIGFAQDAGNGIAELFTDDAGNLTVDWEDIGDAAENNAKAVGIGAVSGLAWLGGQALDILNAGDWASDRDFSTEASEAVQNFSMEVTDDYLGGAPDMSGAWAQTFAFGGGMVAGGAAVKAIKIAGTVGTIGRSVARDGAAINAVAP